MRGILRSQPSSGRRRLRHPRARLFQRRLPGREPQAGPGGVQPGADQPRANRLGSAQLGVEQLRAPIHAPSGGLPGGLDYAARRVRAAGGPNDQASYACECGYVFAAPVSTSVCCPHCGCPQAW